MSAKNGILSQYERDELNKITAKSILEKLMNIRQKIDVEFTARRLIWELIQNAKDNVSLCNGDGEKVDVDIELTENKFIFSHNKGYFTNEHIRGLIRKYSSSDKNRDAQNIGHVHKATGRFGTGFMTTHLLSEKVQVISNYRNDDQTFNYFSFWLNRSGKGEKEIIQGINNAIDEAEGSIEANPDRILSNEDFLTSFIYPLVDKKKKLAEIALEEVRKSIAYTLINVPKINTVTLTEDLIGDTIYSIKKTDTLIHDGHNLLIYNLEINNKKTKNYYITVEDNDIQIIFPISFEKNAYKVLQLETTIPRLHLDFPMIGTEDLNLPFVINSSLFEPTEPRDGISLINDDDNEISQLNCDLVLQAVELYNVFLSYIEQSENWNDLYNLARIKYPERHSWIDYDWFKANVVETLRSRLLHVKIVDIIDGSRISIWNEEGENQVYFPNAANSNVRNKIWELLKEINPESTPIKDHIEVWDHIIWSDCYKFSISELSAEIQDYKNLEVLSNLLQGDEEDALKFLNEYYSLLDVEENHVKAIATDEYIVIPNQKGEFRKRSELFIDEAIDEELKKVCSLLTNDPREYLLYKKAYTGNNIRYPVKKQHDIIAGINSLIKENNGENISDACDYLASLFLVDNAPTPKREAIFNFSQKVYPDDFKEKRKLDNYDEKIWEESDKKSLFYIVSEIADYKTVEEACEQLNFDNKKTFLKWLDSLVSFLVKEKFENNINREKHPILPNQNGVFCTKDNLFLDEGNIGEKLKDISNELGYDFREELLNVSIFLELPENRIYSIIDVAEKISTFIKPILRDVDKRKEHKGTLKKFYIWMNENKDLADMHFSDLFEKRFLFLEDDDISQNMKKATEFDQLMEEHGIKDIDDLRNKLIKLSAITSDEESEIEKINITKEILASLGISSQEDLEKAFKDPAIASRFYHTSTPTTAMFIYAQSLIDRAKENIKEYLRNHPDYDCTDLEETATTTLVGILKKGVPVQIVTRPSDNGEVIVYYSSEKDTLDSDDSELWVDNGISEPHILTLGRILKSTGINKIPIKMN